MDDLNRNELETLRILWEMGEQKPSQIETEFSWEIDNGTLRSVLRVLMEKQLVDRRKDGRAYAYKARKTREGVLAGLTKRLAQVFSSGSTTGFIAQLVESEKLTPEDFAELRRVARSAEKPAGSRRRKGDT